MAVHRITLCCFLMFIVLLGISILQVALPRNYFPTLEMIFMVNSPSLTLRRNAEILFLKIKNL